MTRPGVTARVATLAAAAEGCVTALPMATVAVSTASRTGTAAFAATWVALNGLAAAGAVRLRSDQSGRTWLAAVAVGSGVVVGHGNVAVSAGVALLVLCLGVRLFTRVTRADPAPTGTELWIWTTILGAMAVVASIPHSTWSAAAVVLIPIELALGLAARSVAVWSADQDPGDPTDARVTGARLSHRLALVPLLGSVAAVTIAGPGGPIDRLGTAVGLGLRWIATLVTLVGSLVFFPIAWGWQLVVGRTSDMAGFLSRIRIQQAAELRDPPDASATPLVARLIGLAFLVAIVLAGRAIVRRVTARQVRGDRVRRGGAKVASIIGPAPPGEARHGRVTRQRLPHDRVRRRYAELLLLFARAGLGKEPGQTPAEYLAVIAATYPASSADFETVTRAYETVRYAERLPADTPARAIDAAARRVRQAVRRNRTPPA
jgi:hypothetical protein